MKEVNFPPLTGIETDKSPKTYYLTINIILSLNNCVDEMIDLQNKIIKDDIRTSNIMGPGIYKYPRATIHFSVIDFIDLQSTMDDENKFKEKRKIHIEEITKTLKEFNREPITKKTAEFSYIYTGIPRPCSVAIQAFPSNELLALFNRINEKLKSKKYSTKIKDNNGKKIFTVNLLRFFRGLSDRENDIFKERIDSFNEECKNNGPYFKAKNIKHISFVISDNCLSNNSTDNKAELSFIELR